MADDTKKETSNTDDVITQDAKQRRRYTQSGKSMGEFGENYSYRKQYHHDYHDSSGVKWQEPTITPQGKPLKPPYPSHVREYFNDLGREYHTFEPSEAHDTQQPPLDIQPRKRKEYDPHPIEPWVAPTKDHEGYEKVDDSYELYRDD